MEHSLVMSPSMYRKTRVFVTIYALSSNVPHYMDSCVFFVFPRRFRVYAYAFQRKIRCFGVLALALSRVFDDSERILTRFSVKLEDLASESPPYGSPEGVQRGSDT